MIEVTCSCGKYLRVDDMLAGKKGRCSACGDVLTIPRSAGPAAAESRDCDYCGEAIRATAKKCRHCGEVLDPALRAAEEAKRLATHARTGDPVIINNNVAASAAASAVAIAGGRASLLRRFRQFLGLVLLLFVGGVGLVVSGLDTAGAAMIMVGALLFIVGLPIFLLRGLWRMLFG